MAAKRKTKSNIKTRFTNTKGEKVTVYKDGSKSRSGGSPAQLQSAIDTAKGMGIDTGKAESMLAQDKAEGYKPYKGSSAETAYNVLPKKEVGMISSQTGKNIVQGADQKIADLSPITADVSTPPSQQGTVTTPATTTPKVPETPKETPTDTVTYVNEQTGQEQTFRGGAITDENKKNLESQGYTLASSDVSTVPESPEIAKAQAEYDTASSTVDSYISRLESTLITDKELKGEIRQISASYKARQEEMRNINERRKIAMNTLGTRLGARYTGGTGGIFGSILSEEERQGLDRIEKYENDKQDAILAAKKAAREQNFQTYAQLAQRAEKIQEKKATELQALKKAQAEQNAKIAKEAKQAEYDALIIEQLGTGETDPIKIVQALAGKVPFDQIKSITELLPKPEGPVTLGKSDILVDPKTGKVIARGIGEASTGGGTMGSVEAQYWADLINQGKAKLENVPEKLRSSVVTALAGGEPTMSKANEQALAQAQTAINSIDSVINSLDEVGIVERSILSMLPGTEARDVENTIETVQALIGFDALAQMRAASPTGGALGSITEKELRYLQSVQGSLDPLQSTATLKKNLESIKKSFSRIRAINSVGTTPEEYKKEFPDATEEELREIRARSTKKTIQDNANMSNKDLFNTGSWSTQSTTPMSMDVFNVIGL